HQRGLETLVLMARSGPFTRAGKRAVALADQARPRAGVQDSLLGSCGPITSMAATLGCRSGSAECGRSGRVAQVLRATKVGFKVFADSLHTGTVCADQRLSIT